MKRKPAKVIDYNPINDPKRMYGYKNVRWVENVSEGLRLVGFADEIARKEGNWRAIDHKGWYTMDDCDGDIFRGVVYQLPSRDGECYVYGYADPNNDDCALLCFDILGDKMEAARAADRFAEICAEHERDYQRAWQAGRQCEELDDEVKAMRKEALAIAAEMREAKRLAVKAPTICATLRAEVLSLYRRIVKARKKRDELRSDFGKCEGFADA